MNNNQVQNVSMALLFVIIFLSGYWLSRERKPYSMLLLTIHKLIAVGAFVALIITTVRANRAGELRAASISAGIVTGVFFLSLIATGGLLSSEVETPAFVSTVHHLAPYLTLLATVITLYLLRTPI